jgi:hypothetical protein
VIDIPRNTGVDADGIAKSEADHFMKCPEGPTAPPLPLCTKVNIRCVVSDVFA